jgi:hypothetical protein
VNELQSVPPKPVGPADVDHPRTALARLMFSAAAQELAEKATVLVPTVSDESASATYEWVETAARTVRQAQEVLTRAVIWAAERGLNWTLIAEALGAEDTDEIKAVRDEHQPAVDAWEDVLNDPHELIHGIGKLVWIRRVPDVDQTASYLDEWCAKHVDPSLAELYDVAPDRMVSARLPKHSELTELNRELRVGSRLFRDHVPMDHPEYVAHQERRAALTARVDARLNRTKPKDKR